MTTNPFQMTDHLIICHLIYSLSPLTFETYGSRIDFLLVAVIFALLSHSWKFKALTQKKNSNTSLKSFDNIVFLYKK